MKLDEVLHSAKAALAQTAVPEQDAAVARAHMHAAFQRSLASKASVTVSAPIDAEQKALAAQLAFASANRTSQSRDEGHDAGRSGNSKMKWLLSFAMLILAAIWLQMPVNKLANTNDLVSVSGIDTINTDSISTNLMRDFVPLVDTQTWQQAQRGWVVSTELPVTELASMGLPFDATKASDTLPAELLMSESGELLGVRLLRADSATGSDA